MFIFESAHARERGRGGVPEAGCELTAESPMPGSNSWSVRSWPEQKSDAYLTEPPRCPARWRFKNIYIIVVRENSKGRGFSLEQMSLKWWVNTVVIYFIKAALSFSSPPSSSVWLLFTVTTLAQLPSFFASWESSLSASTLRKMCLQGTFRHIPIMPYECSFYSLKVYWLYFVLDLMILESR